MDHFFLSSQPLESESKSSLASPRPPGDPNAPKIFGEGGATLQQLLDYERTKYPDLHIEVPLVIQRSLDFLMEKGLNAEGRRFGIESNLTFRVI
jgi:hypothetical protein